MPAGLKQTSSIVSIGFSVTETAANTFTEGRVDLNLSPLDNEVFVVLAVDINPSTPTAADATNTTVDASLTTTSQTGIVNLSEPNCIAFGVNAIRAPAGGGQMVAFQSSAMDTPPANLEYIAIIATNDFFVQVEGTNCDAAKGVSGKLYGYRARATADIYAALVQSEVLSA